MSNLKIYEALRNVQNYMYQNPIAKEGVNTFQKYKYRGIDQIIQAFSKPLHDNNILTVVQPDLKVSTKFLEDGRSTLTRVVGTLRFISTEDGSYVDRSYVGHSKSQQGKDLESARSFAYRNSLLETFCVPFEGVVEPELEGIDKDAPAKDGSEEVSMFYTLIDDFKKDLAKCQDVASAKKVYLNYKKAADLSGDEEIQKKLILEYTKAFPK